MKILLFNICLLSTISYAGIADGDYAAQLQLNISKPDLKNSGGVDEKYNTTAGAGVRALWGLNDSGLSLRSGLALRHKRAEFYIGGIDSTLDYLYLSVPFTLHYIVATKSTTKFGFFGGVGASILIDDYADVDGKDESYVYGKTLVMPLIVGFDVMLGENWGVEASYEYGLTSIWRCPSWMRLSSHDYVRLNSLVLGVYYQLQ